MNYWDMLPNDLQDNILQEKAAKTLQRNFRRHPALRSKCLAKGCIDQWGGVHIISPLTAAALEYCAKHSGKGDDTFWSDFCLKVLDSRIEERFSTDMGHGWIERCSNAHHDLVEKYSDVWCRLAPYAPMDRLSQAVWSVEQAYGFYD